jgi:uroporphyrinogen-III synthase
MVRTEASDTSEAPLYGRGIVVTRPAGHSERLASLVAAAGGTPIVFPLIDIRPASDVTVARDHLGRIGEYDLVVFVSANAVEHGCALLTPGAVCCCAPWIAGVGVGTARAL